MIRSALYYSLTSYSSQMHSISISCHASSSMVAFQTRRDEAVVFNLHIAFLTVKGKQRGFVNVEDYDIVVDG